VTVSAVAATLIRFWFVDPFSFATTRVWDFARTDHAHEIVKMVAFLLGPINDVLQTWKPPLERFRTRLPAKRSNDSTEETEKPESHPADGDFTVLNDRKLSSDASMYGESSSNQFDGGKEPAAIKHWEWLSEGYKELWWQDKLLFGRRTTLWEGKIRPVDVRKTVTHAALAAEKEGQTTPQPSLDCHIKATYLPPGLAEHEHEMLVCLNPDVPLPEDSEFKELDQQTKDEILQNIPRSLGLVEFETPDNITTRVLPASVRVDDLQRPDLTHLRLVVLAIQGPIGNTLEPRSDNLTLADVCEIYQGVFGQLWYGAEKGVHFRDVSPGNILWKLLPDGRKVGFLIDYGNARFENERRDKSLSADTGKGVCEDDLRSGTPHFLCVAVLDAAKALDAYRTKVMAIADQMDQDQDQDPEEAEQLAAYALKLLVNRHRYIDDLETALYNLLWHVSLPVL